MYKVEGVMEVRGQDALVYNSCKQWLSLSLCVDTVPLLYILGNLGCLVVCTNYPLRCEFGCPLYRVLRYSTNHNTYTLAL